MNQKIFGRIAIVAFALLVQAAFAGSTELYTYVFNRRLVTVPIGKIDGVRVNDVCLKDQAQCQAWSAFRSSPKAKPHSSKNGETHASDHCHALGGTPLVLSNSSQSSSLFCVFQDLSMVDARAMEYAHLKQHPSK